MRRCFYHTDLGQNAVFHNFALQIALIQYLGRSKHAWASRGLLAKPLKKISKITHTASRRVLTFDKRQSRLFKLRLIELYAST